MGVGENGAGNGGGSLDLERRSVREGEEVRAGHRIAITVPAVVMGSFVGQDRRIAVQRHGCPLGGAGRLQMVSVLNFDTMLDTLLRSAPQRSQWVGQRLMQPSSHTDG